jgi:hypothetical protein
MRRITWSGAVLVALLATAALASAARATATWQCSSSSVTASVAGNPAANPVTSNGSPCVSSATGLDSLPTPLGLPANALSAQTTSATTTATPGDEIPANQGVAAIGRVENLAVQLPPGSGTTTLGIRAANAQATGICVAGTPVLDGKSEALGATLGGQEIPLDQAAQQIAAGLAPLGDAVDLKVDEQIHSATGLTVNAIHLKILSAAGTPVLDLIAGQAHVGYSGSVCDANGQVAGGGAGGRGSAGSANSGVLLANGVRGGTCGRLAMYFARNHKRSLTNRYGRRAVVRGRIVNCAGKSIVRARIDVVHVLKNGKRKLVKTGLRSREGGKLTLILPMNIKTRDLRFEYRGNLLSSRVTSRSTLHVTVRNRRGKLLR